MVMKFNIKKLIKNLAIPLLVGIVSGFLTRGGVEQFKTDTIKPVFSPPDWLFPVVWTILYILMGISSYIIDIKVTTNDKRTATVLYYLQLAFNFFWSFIFFNFQAYLPAFVWIIILWVLIIATTIEFYKIDKAAGILMVPYLIWVTFAAVLNFSIYLLN
jgi:tryptophan-rich sensory protein